MNMFWMIHALTRWLAHLLTHLFHVLDTWLPLELHITGVHVCQHAFRLHVAAQNKAKSLLPCLNCWFWDVHRVKAFAFPEQSLLVCIALPSFPSQLSGW